MDFETYAWLYMAGIAVHPEQKQLHVVFDN